MTLLYGGRTPDQLLFRDELEAWGAECEVATTVDAAERSWRGRVGVVPGLVGNAGLDTEAVAFVCGPELMMQFSLDALDAAGLAAERIFLSMERSMPLRARPLRALPMGPLVRVPRRAGLSWSDAASRLRVRELRCGGQAEARRLEVHLLRRLQLSILNLKDELLALRSRSRPRTSPRRRRRTFGWS